MLTDKDLDIKKLILDRTMQIDDEIVDIDPEYKQLGLGCLLYTRFFFYYKNPFHGQDIGSKIGNLFCRYKNNPC